MNFQFNTNVALAYNVWWYGVVADYKHEPLNNNRT